MPTDHATGPADDGPDFGSVYTAGRRSLLLQTYALTGDLAAARGAVDEAYRSAAQHWRTVAREGAPDERIRRRAWALARRRHRSRPWHREKGPDAEQQQVLRALDELDGEQRRALLLRHLVGLDDAALAAELEVAELRGRQVEVRARSRFTEAVDAPDDAAGVVAALETLGPLVDALPAPGAEELQTSGRRRRRARVAAGVAAALAIVLLGGLLVVDRTSDAEPDQPAAEPTAEAVSAEMLLGSDDLAVLGAGRRWRETGTDDNTDGNGINTVCQTSRFADPEGEGTLVRRFASVGAPRRTVLETVEVSRTTTAATDAYSTTLSWFAGCREARLQLLGSYRVEGLGARAEVLVLRVPSDGTRRTYVVGLARTGLLTVSTVVETVDGDPVEVRRLSRLLRTAVASLCEADGAGSCPRRVEVSRVLPPASGETPGTLAAADLPPVGRIARPWVGTRPAPARPNPSATTCDAASFVRSGATRARSRTYLVPEARVPARFGLTQTYGTFPRPPRATAFVDDVVAAMRSCEDDDLAATVQEVVVERDGFRGSTVAAWRLDSEVGEDRTVGYWMGLAQVGPHVTQVLFTPTPGVDLDPDTFQAVVLRARDRLFELTEGPR